MLSSRNLVGQEECKNIESSGSEGDQKENKNKVDQIFLISILFSIFANIKNFLPIFH